MKRIATAWLLVLCLCLSGCGSFLTGEFIWEQSHYIPPVPDSGQDIVASDFAGLVRAISDGIEQGMELLTISVAQYDRDVLQADVEQATETVCRTNPVAAYAVSDVNWQIGTTAGETVLILQIQYLHDQSEIKKIQTVSDNTEAWDAIATAIDNCDSGIVLRIDNYEAQDFQLAIEA